MMMKFNYLLLSLASIGLCLLSAKALSDSVLDSPSVSVSLSYEQAQKVIRKEVRSYSRESLSDESVSLGRPLCREYSCCNVTSANSCSVARMPKDETTLVLPGGNTRCINSYSTPFAFQVIPGDSDKLLFYFQGGGACWNEGSTKAGFCTSDSSPQSLVGVFDRTNANNKFKTYTIVHVLYCSGDVFGGNTTRPYNDKDGQPIVQAGLANAQSALDWVKSQVSAKNLAQSFSSLVVMGCSAGSIGAQLWGDQVLSALKWKTAAVIPDSYAGVFPPGSMGPLIYEYGFCSSGFLSAALQEKCLKQELTLQDMDMEFMKNSPNVPFSFIQSKTDIVQQSFYIAIGVSMNSSEKMITPTLFYTDVNEVFGLYNTLPNFVTYLVDGFQHCFTNKDIYYTADPISKNDDGKSTTTEMMYAWTNKFPLQDGESASTACDGALVAKSSAGADNSYCSSAVSPKSFVEQY